MHRPNTISRRSVFARYASILFIAVLFLMSAGGHAFGQGATPQTPRTDPATVTAAATAISAGAAVVGGLVTWMNDQSDDCAAAGVAAVSGCECGVREKSCTDTGYLWASTEECDDDNGESPKVSNACGFARAHAYAEEDLFGSWWERELVVEVDAQPAPSECGDNEAYAWGWASVDGTAKTDKCIEGEGQNCEEGSKGAMYAWRGDAQIVRVDFPEGKTDWPENTILALVMIDQFTMTVGEHSPTAPEFMTDLLVDGNLVWEGSVTSDGDGGSFLTGDLAGGDSATTYDEATGQWTTTLSQVIFEIPIGIQGDDTQVHDFSLQSTSTSNPSKNDPTGKPLNPVDSMEVDCCEPTPRPRETLGLAAAPNPFNPQTKIRFTLAVDANIDLGIYDVSGRRVATLASGTLGAGDHSRTWLGRTDDGTGVASGIYFAVLRQQDQVAKHKLLLMK